MNANPMADDLMTDDELLAAFTRDSRVLTVGRDLLEAALIAAIAGVALVNLAALIAARRSLRRAGDTPDTFRSRQLASARTALTAGTRAWRTAVWAPRTNSTH